MVDIEVPKTFTKDESFKYMTEVMNNKLKNKLSKNSILNSLEVKANAGTTWVGLGNYTKYKAAPPKGDMNFSYDFEMINDFSGYDYYAIKGTVEGTPGDALYHYNKSYEDKWEVQELQTRIRCDYPQSTSNILKSGPDTTSGSGSYTVELGGGVTFPKPEGSATFALSWTRNFQDTNISKTIISAREVYWKDRINDYSSTAESTASFYPGANIRIPQSSTYCNVYIGSNFVVDSWYNSEVAACGHYVNASMYPNKVSFYQ